MWEMAEYDDLWEVSADLLEGDDTTGLQAAPPLWLRLLTASHRVERHECLVER